MRAACQNRNPGMRHAWRFCVTYLETISVVYFVQMGETGPIKIGTTRGTVQRRVAGLQCSCAETLILRGLVRGGRQVEKDLHDRFSREHVRGEWFRPSEDLVRFIAALPPLSPPAEGGVAAECHAEAHPPAPPAPRSAETVPSVRHGQDRRRRPRPVRAASEEAQSDAVWAVWKRAQNARLQERSAVAVAHEVLLLERNGLVLTMKGDKRR